MSAPSPRPSNRALPPKESGFFKQILRQYEHKQYKKGLKATEQILKKFPDHGESLAMKGLFLSHLDGKDQSYDYVKKGLRYDLFSPICWHVYGLLYRSDKNYEEAVKCYRHALKYDKENVQVLRDFSFLQMQMRDYHGYNETTHELLRLRANQRNYWVGLAVSYQLLKKHETAIKVLDAYEETVKEPEPGTPIDFEHSELLLYKNVLMQEMGDMGRALRHLDQIEPRVCDKRSLREYRASLLVRLGSKKEGEAAYLSLIKENPESLDYLRGVLRARGLDPNSTDEATRQSITEYFGTLQTEYPRSHMLERTALDYASGDRFVTLLDAYLKKMFRKGVPSVFANLKAIVTTSREKTVAMETLVNGYLAQLSSTGTLSPDDAEKEPPATELWALYFLSQLQDKQGKYQKAMETIEKALVHTPTLLELHVFKSRIHKHLGNPKMAAACMEEARKMDLQDRFMNTKSTKYHIRNDQIATAETTIGLFTRQGDHAERMADLVDMQCMWFALECGESFLRLNQPGKALKRFHQIQKHFDDIIDDQFDFHTYCLRKATVRSYVALLRQEDILHTHPYYLRATIDAVGCYVAIFDSREKGMALDGGADAELTAEQKKKLASKQRRAAAQEKVQQQQQLDEKQQNSAAKKPRDTDPDGEKLLEGDFMAEALKFLTPLLMLAPNNLTVHLLSFEVYSRQNKALPAYRAVYQATRLAPTDPRVHTITMRFWQLYAQQWRKSVAVVSRQLVEQSEPPLLPMPANLLAEPSATLVALNDSFMAEQQAAKNALGVFEAVKAKLQLQPDSTAECVSALGALDTFSLATATEIDTWLERQRLSTDQFRTKCRSLFPHACRFMTAEDLLALDVKLLNVGSTTADVEEDETKEVAL